MNKIEGKKKKYKKRKKKREIYKNRSLKSRLPCLWTRNYYAGTIGHVSEQTVKKYIENQKNV